MFYTRRELQQRLEEWFTWVAGAGIAAAVAASLTVIFLPLAMWFVIGSAGLMLAGWSASRVLPRLWRFNRVTCPYCRSLNEVRPGLRTFYCDACGRAVSVRDRGRGVLLTLIKCR